MTVVPFQPRSDGYGSLLSGLGIPGVDGAYGQYAGNSFFTNNGLRSFLATRYSNFQLTSLYITNGIAQKIIDKPADDAFQRGVTIENDDDELIEDEYDRLQVTTRMADALRWSRLYGGAALVLVAQDGGTLIDPLNLDTLDQVHEIKVYDITCIQGTDVTYQDESNPETFGKMEFYDIHPPQSSAFRIHETRLIPVSGEALPPNVAYYNRISWAGRSVLESCAKDITRYEQGLDWTLKLLERKQQAVYQMQGLGEMFAQGDDPLVVKRVNMVDQVRGNLNTVVIDKEDAYEIKTVGMDGVQQALATFETALCASSKMQNTMLFGKSSTGLNANGAGDLESHYTMVAHIQEVIARPPLEKLTSILWCQKDFRSKIPDDWHIKFNSLWVPSAQEKAQTEFVEAQAANQEITALTTLMGEQIMTAEEVREVVIEEYYNEYGFSIDLPDFPDELQYAQGVDTSQLQIPANGKPGEPIKVPKVSVPVKKAPPK